MLRVLFTASLATALASAQGNTIPGLGVRLAELDDLNANGRTGTYPNGRNGFSCLVSVCNNGSVPVNWFAAMDPQHPFYAFLLCREVDGRFVQISDRSFVKHGYASINDNLCGTCQPPPLGMAQLGVNCSDTYWAGLNANPLDLGPPAEIDPWLWQWNPIGSHFDRGEPSVAGPAATDGIKSLSFAMASAMGLVRHRIEVDDADLGVAGARFFLAGSVWVRGETEGTRQDNMLSREVLPTWATIRWRFANVTAPVPGSVLQHWTGAQVQSAANGTDDGRVYVGARVTQLPSGLWRYEYALHNRDNSRGIAAIRLPRCANARIVAAGARDIDANPLNDWTVATTPTEVAFLAGAENALEWNCVYNVWFDSDAAPEASVLLLDQARPGAGALQFPVGMLPAPRHVPNETYGPACGNPAPTVTAFGQPAIARLGNTSFSVRVTAEPMAPLVLFVAEQQDAVALGNGCMQLLEMATLLTWTVSTADAAGRFDVAQPVPSSPALEGMDACWQAIAGQNAGPLYGAFAVSSGLRVRVGDLTTGCQ